MPKVSPGMIYQVVKDALLWEKAETKRCLLDFLALDSHRPVLLRPVGELGALGDNAAAAEAWCAARFAPAELADAQRVDAAASGVLPSPPPCGAR